MASPKLREYELFFDESGTFMETSTDAGELAESRKGRQFASQLAGLLAPAGWINRQSAAEVVARLSTVLGRQLCHASDIADRSAFNRVVTAMAPMLQERGWQPVRLVNAEKVSYGQRAATYLNMVAELLVQICSQKLLEGEPRLRFRVVPAAVYLGDRDDGQPDIIEPWEYEYRLREWLTFINVRRGYSRESTGWGISEVRLGSAQNSPDLILCDLISNASHDNYCRLDPDTAALLKAAFGRYDRTLMVRELVERVELMLQENSLGFALIALAERLVQKETDHETRIAASAKLQEVLKELGRMASRVRNPQLAHLTGWLEQIIDLQRSLHLGLRLVAWTQESVQQPLAELLGPEQAASLDWFIYQVAFWALTACNHSGAVLDAIPFADAIERVSPALVKHWEHAATVTRGLIANAVHKIDCFEYDLASHSMAKLAACDKAVSGLFAEEMGGGSGATHSDLRAQALGTQLQAEILAGLAAPPRLLTARQLSDEAIQEFSDPADVARQWQYRCQLETAAGQFSTARDCLSRSLQQAESSHRAIARAIREVAAANPGAEGFLLLHWFRLGTAAILAQDVKERDEFVQAVEEVSLLDSAWTNGGEQNYPANGILRRAAVLHAFRNRKRRALEILSVLRRNFNPIARRQIPLALVQAAAEAEVAAILFPVDPQAAADVLGTARHGLLHTLDETVALTRGKVPRIHAFLTQWIEQVRQVSSLRMPPGDAAELLLLSPRSIDY